MSTIKKYSKISKTQKGVTRRNSTVHPESHNNHRKKSNTKLVERSLKPIYAWGEGESPEHLDISSSYSTAHGSNSSSIHSGSSGRGSYKEFENMSRRYNAGEPLIKFEPPSDAEYTYMSLSESLEELFSMISVMASKILTISDLEKAINNWKLDNTSDVNMYRSLTHLIDLLKRSSEHRDRDAPLHNPEIFRQAITCIQRDSGLPMQLSKSLNEARLKIRDTDTMPELNNILVGCMNQ